MKYIIAIFLLVFSVSLSYGNINSKGEGMFLENESKYDFAETVKLVTEELLENGWKIPATHDLQQTLKKSNYDVLPVTVIETCNPNLAVKILERDEERIVSSLLPCRMSIYKKADGKTYISRMNAKLFASQLSPIVEDTMMKAFNEVEVVLSKIIK
jgi:uncharacterized protein (DUF302 family)